MLRHLIMATCLAISLANGLHAAEVTFAGPTVRPVTSEEVADEGGPSPKSRVYDFFLSSDADIVSLASGSTSLVGSQFIYNNAAGSDTAPPNPLFLEVFPALAADSWITTPGTTFRDTCPFDSCATRLWMDTTDDGPQTNFQFARRTSASPFVFEGVVTVAGPTGPEAFPFAFSIVPEPSALLVLGLGLTSLLINRRRTSLLSRDSC